MKKLKDKMEKAINFLGPMLLNYLGNEKKVIV
jgi:hypothetical protein